MVDVLRTDGATGQVIRWKDMGDGTIAETISSVVAGVVDVSITESVPVEVITAVPLAADILAGRTATDAATIITVPAGRTWRGTVVLSAAIGTAPAVAGATATPTVSIAGAGAVPAAGVILGLALRTGGGAATGTVGTNSQGTASLPLVVIAPAGNAVTLTLQLGGATAASASAAGELL